MKEPVIQFNERDFEENNSGWSKANIIIVLIVGIATIVSVLGKYLIRK